MSDGPEQGGIRAVEVRVSGMVQGVAFRWTTQVQAERLGVAGWVRNELDGTVTGHFEGPPDAVDALVAWTHHGPSGAGVERVEVVDSVPEGLTGFDVRF